MSQEFYDTMEKLVSNDQSIRESALEKTRTIVKLIKEDVDKLYLQVWKSIFYCKTNF